MNTKMASKFWHEKVASKNILGMVYNKFKNFRGGVEHVVRDVFFLTTAFGLLGSLMQSGPVNTVKGIGNYIGKYTSFLTNIYPHSVRANMTNSNASTTSPWAPTGTKSAYNWSPSFTANAAVKRLSI